MENVYQSFAEACLYGLFVSAQVDPEDLSDNGYQL